MFLCISCAYLVPLEARRGVRTCRLGLRQLELLAVWLLETKPCLGLLQEQQVSACRDPEESNASGLLRHLLSWAHLYTHTHTHIHNLKKIKKYKCKEIKVSVAAWVCFFIFYLIVIHVWFCTCASSFCYCYSIV